TEPPRSLTTISAPRFASSSACERPRPPPAPVMIATFPSNPRSAMPRTVTRALTRERVRGRRARRLDHDDDDLVAVVVVSLCGHRVVARRLAVAAVEDADALLPAALELALLARKGR